MSFEINPKKRSQRPSPRQGFGLTEMIIALLLLGMLSCYILPMFNKLGTMQRRIEKQTLLQQKAMNLIEQLHTLSAHQTSDIKAVQKQLEQQIDSQKNELILSSHPAEKTGMPIRIDLELRPVEKQDVLTAVKLSTWISFPQTTEETE